MDEPNIAIPNALKRRVGPLPLYGWGAAGAVGVGVWFFVRRRRSGQSSLFGGDTNGVAGSGSSTGNTGNTGGGSGGGGGGSPSTTCASGYHWDNVAGACVSDTVTGGGNTPECYVPGYDNFGYYDCQNGRKVRVGDGGGVDCGVGKHWDITVGGCVVNSGGNTGGDSGGGSGSGGSGSGSGSGVPHCAAGMHWNGFACVLNAVDNPGGDPGNACITDGHDTRGDYKCVRDALGHGVKQYI